jgi:hypothetical protein
VNDMFGVLDYFHLLAFRFLVLGVKIFRPKRHAKSYFLH